jgi:hypothetical protein
MKDAKDLLRQQDDWRKGSTRMFVVPYGAQSFLAAENAEGGCPGSDFAGFAASRELKDRGSHEAGPKPAEGS